MLSPQTHRIIFLFGLFSLMFGMMIGAVPTSVPQLILLGNWLVEMDFKRKWNEVKNNKIFWALTSIFLIHLIGMLYTSNWSDGCADIKIEVPLLFLPLVFFNNKPLSLKEFHLAGYCFLAGCVANTGWCFVYNFLLHKTEAVRYASRFMSHIRLGLYLNMGIAFCFYFMRLPGSSLKRLGFSLLGIYFLFAMYALGLITGLVNFFILCFIGVAVIIYLQRPIMKIVAGLFLVGAVFFVFKYTNQVKEARTKTNDSPNNKIQLQSPSGRYYAQFDSTGPKENGNFIFRNIQTEELKKEWTRAFPADSFSFPPNPHNLNRYEVLIRYLSSKGLNKDSAGIAQLSTLDKKNIQKNIPNYQYTEWSFLHRRTYELVCEYDDYINNRNVNGQSLTMRLYFWKAAAHLIKENPILGVGTGDVQQELNRTYVETHSPLNKEWYKRPHNQFLTITVAFGIIGFFVFLIHLIYPAITLRKFLPIVYWPFIILAIISFFMEDTLETQAGVTFYAVFNSLFVSVAWFDKNHLDTKCT